MNADHSDKAILKLNFSAIAILLLAVTCFGQTDIAYEDTENLSIVLQDGRQLGYAEYGDPVGSPVVYHYGGGGSRLLGRRVDPLATSAGVRLIVPDRPGMGSSDLVPDRMITDWPSDLAQLMDHLEIDKFAVMSESAGTPYALVLAYALPERVSKVAVVAGICPIDENMIMSDLPRMVRASFNISRKAPLWFLRWNFKSTHKLVVNNPEKFIKLVTRKLPEPDLKALEDPADQETMLLGFTEAGKQGPAGPALEMRLYARPWGFDLNEIAVPVHIYHGELDANVPVLMAGHLTVQIPDAKRTVFPDEGHMSVMKNHGSEILSELIME